MSNFPVSCSLYAASKLDKHESLKVSSIVGPNPSQTNQARTEFWLFSQKYYWGLCLWNNFRRSYKEQQRKQCAWLLIEKKLGKEGNLYTYIHMYLIFAFERLDFIFKWIIWAFHVYRGVPRWTLPHLRWRSLGEYFAAAFKKVVLMTIICLKSFSYSHKNVAELLDWLMVQNSRYTIEALAEGDKACRKSIAYYTFHCSNWRTSNYLTI